MRMPKKHRAVALDGSISAYKHFICTDSFITATSSSALKFQLTSASPFPPMSTSPSFFSEVAHFSFYLLLLMDIYSSPIIELMLDKLPSSFLRTTCHFAQITTEEGITVREQMECDLPPKTGTSFWRTSFHGVNALSGPMLSFSATSS